MSFQIGTYLVASLDNKAMQATTIINLNLPAPGGFSYR